MKWCGGEVEDDLEEVEDVGEMRGEVGWAGCLSRVMFRGLVW